MRAAVLIIEEMKSLYNEKEASNLSRFFKTGKGEYGEGDKFLGIKVPVTRSIVKKNRNNITLEDVKKLIDSEWHEVRLAGFLLLLELYKISLKENDIEQTQLLVDFYLNNIERGNNWDLVDLVASYILGDWVLRNPAGESILLELACNDGYLWHQRVAIVSTFTLIKAGKFKLTFQIAEKYLSHSHDLIHKSTGWMLREIGKRGGKEDLIKFLESHKSKMPRTMLRYAIERFPETERKYFMKKTISV
ncbi:MAG: DNA alkylation repair protein [Muribaculaceae bacterium]|nr:DNA alkylation repair protein [Muribaculaceae bacterium]